MTVSGTLRVPGDKSISHRALLLSALSDGPCRIAGILESADVRSTADVLRTLGFDIPRLASDVVVRGSGLHAVKQPLAPLDCGNSGTTTRLIAGVAAASPVMATFIGDASLSRRPMRRVARPLAAMGARIELPPHEGLPMTIHGGSLQPIEWRSDVASAQVKSAVLLAALVAGVNAAVMEPMPSRDHTERMLAARGISVTVNNGRVHIAGEGRLRAVDVRVPGDPSSAAFFAALAAVADAGHLVLEHVCVNETRTGFLRLLRGMGARVAEEGRHHEGGEPVADLVVGPGALRGATVGAIDVPSMIDELPLLACIATRTSGETIITGARELRVKESDRIAAVVGNLRTIGACADELPDGMRITGSRGPLTGRVITQGDHRLAMAFGVLGAIPGNEIEVDDPDCVTVSYPNFWADLARVRSG